ncbi:MAG: response regulator [Burkholderiales bacterium]|jgi:two-component system response regulator QseB|nr:response regulator [Burkholderiales bacterium]
MRILLLEDDAQIGDGLKAGLSQYGFAVDWFNDGVSGLKALGAAPYDAVVLDLGLPGLDGMEVLSKWRQTRQDVPVLILTARDALEHRVGGLNAGADDYLVKPFALSELVARLNALIRRRYGKASVTLTCDTIKFDLASRIVTQNDVPVMLSARELALLELFMQNKGRVLLREMIIEKLYNWESEIDSNIVDVYIHHLRRKLGIHVIRTVRGVGYILGGDIQKDVS